jgi:hypothetical protein
MDDSLAPSGLKRFPEKQQSPRASLLVLMLLPHRAIRIAATVIFRMADCDLAHILSFAGVVSVNCFRGC